MTLHAEVGETSLSPETFAKAGAFTYYRAISPALIHSYLLPLVFQFDKAVTPSQADGRELAAVVLEVSLEPTTTL